MTAPTAPLVDCARSKAAQVPAIPGLADMDVWALQLMGLYQVEVTKRVSEDGCLNKLRDKGGDPMTEISEVIENLKWAMKAARDANDYMAVNTIACVLAGILRHRGF